MAGRRGGVDQPLPRLCHRSGGKEGLASFGGLDVEDIVAPETQRKLSKSIMIDDELFLLQQDAPRKWGSR